MRKRCAVNNAFENIKGGVQVANLNPQEVANLNPQEVASLNPQELYNEGKDLTEIEKGVREVFLSDEGEDIHAHIQKCIDELKEKGLIT